MNDTRDDDIEDDGIVTMVRACDPITSIEAANAVSGKKETIRAHVLAMHRQYPEGLTDSELRAKLDAKAGYERGHSTYRSRRRELADDGLIIPTADMRKNPKGSREIVWRVRREGEEVPALIRKTAAPTIRELAVAAEREACKAVVKRFIGGGADTIVCDIVLEEILDAIEARGTE